MKYCSGKTGRIFVARLESGDPIYESIESLAATEDVACAAVWILGGVKNGKVIVGPKSDEQMPPEIMIESFTDAREILGLGTMFRNESNEPKLHLHAAIGKGTKPIVGCPRIGADCWLVNEVVIMEIAGLDAVRATDPVSGLELLQV